MANKPVQEIRLGLVRTAVWENQTANGPRYNVTVSRLYKDGDEWKTSDCFNRDDLPLLAKAVDLAHTWIYLKTQDGITRTPSDDAEDRGKRNNNHSPNSD